MARLILFLLAICLIAATVTMIASALRPVVGASQGGPMSSQFRKIAYLALFLLMMGLTTGLLGGL
ncbi:hypothetical protein AAD018_004705 [Aestuariibius insulae]|uniref:hypothetical protein n=1 Tax=Aestuariibius insulae TaxID=2058287 RepID=UPI00345EFE4C